MPEFLQRLRKSEKRQTLFYRGLAADAELAGDEGLAERFNELHADEQHHLSRLTARLLELGLTLHAVDGLERPPCELSEWEGAARRREQEEIAMYEEALAKTVDDPVTQEILEEILASERQHEKNLGGKWMPA